MRLYSALAAVCVGFSLTGCIPIFVGERRPPESGKFDTAQAERAAAVLPPRADDSVVARPIGLRRADNGFYLDVVLVGADPVRVQRAGSQLWSGISYWEGEESRPFALRDPSGSPVMFRRNSEPSLFFFPIPIPSAPYIGPYPSRTLGLADGRVVLVQEAAFRGSLPVGDAITFVWNPVLKDPDMVARGVVMLDADGPLPVR